MSAANLHWGSHFRTDWRLSGLPRGTKRYSAALALAAQSRATREDVSVQPDPTQAAIVVSVELEGDEMPAAIDRSMTLVFQLIRAAGLQPPGSLWLVVTELKAP